MSRTLYLHIGAPKAASTTLQKRVFPFLEDVAFVSKPRFDLVPRRYSWDGELASLVLDSPDVWATHGQTFFQRLNALPGVAESKAVLVSDENMSVNRGLVPQHLYQHLARFIDLARQHGYSRIRLILVTRRQDEWLASAYAQTSYRFAKPGQKDFERWIAAKLGTDQAFQTAGIALDYNSLHLLLSELVSTEDCLVLPLEMLAHRPQGFTTALRDFLGQTPRQDDSALTDNQMRMNVRSTGASSSTGVRAWQLRPTSFWRRWSPGAIQLDGRLTAAIMNRYGPGNLALAQRLGIPLADYGYGPVAVGEGT